MPVINANPPGHVMKVGSLISGQTLHGDRKFGVYDKFSGVQLAEVTEATQEHVSAAVAAAAAAFEKGAPAPASLYKILNRMAALMEERKDRLSDVIVAETGFTIADARNEVDRAVVTAGLCADEARRLVGETVSFGASPGHENRLGLTIRVPIGIVGAITPFNSPLNTVFHKIGPALAAGNAVVLKPSGLTPLSADALCHLFFEAGLPTGLLHVVHGLDATVGERLLAEKDIGFFTFTGSTRVGQRIQQAAGLRRTQLELGSIASTIVCADADLSRATPKIANAAFRKAGQVCTSVQRLYVERSVVEELTARLIREASQMPTGNPRHPDTRIGPMISEQSAIRAANWIEEAQAQQARVLAGGTRSASVLEPTILTNVKAGMKVIDEEIFAPVVSIIPFDELNEAVVQANATPFGLSSGVFTSDVNRGLRAAKSLRFGSVHLNETSSARADGMPFGGVKASGFGKEGPLFAIREMTEERLITFNL
jgi:succinate-semialdehyde dehydrogenase/glutarate-semialdehyde dehydrogenase